MISTFLHSINHQNRSKLRKAEAQSRATLHAPWLTLITLAHLPGKEHNFQQMRLTNDPCAKEWTWVWTPCRMQNDQDAMWWQKQMLRINRVSNHHNNNALWDKEWKGALPNHILNIYSKPYSQRTAQLNSGQVLNRHFYKETLQIANDCIKRFHIITQRKRKI